MDIAIVCIKYVVSKHGMGAYPRTRKLLGHGKRALYKFP